MKLDKDKLKKCAFNLVKMDVDIRKGFLKLVDEYTNILNDVSKKYFGKPLIELDPDDLEGFMSYTRRVWKDELTKIIPENKEN